MRIGPLVVCATLLSTALGSAARQQPEQFEVASIKRNVSRNAGGSYGAQPGGRFVAINVAPLTLIQNAYQFEFFRIVDAPGWATTDRYDVTATAGQSITAEQMRVRLRALLVDRFGLVAHPETREMQTYALLRARSDGQLGPNLKPWTIDCKTYKPKPEERVPPQTVEDLTKPRPCGMSGGSGLLVAGGRPIDTLVRSLAGELRTPVTDHTGLAGDYEMSLRWNQDPARDAEFPSLFTALQDQLGLKLESRREPIEVLVIDKIDRPTEN